MNGFTLLVAAIALVAYATWGTDAKVEIGLRMTAFMWLVGIALFIASVALAMAAALGIVRWW